MARTNDPTGLFRHGHSLQSVKEWRTREYEAGRPSGYDDFLRAHHLCTECRGNGKFPIGVRWRDNNGTERSEQGPVAVLVQKHKLEDPANWLSDTLKWDYLYKTCEACEGTGTTA